MSESTIITKLTGSEIFVENIKSLNFNIKIILSIICICIIYSLLISIFAKPIDIKQSCKCIECSIETFKNEIKYKHLNSSIARLSSVLDINENPLLFSTGISAKYLIQNDTGRYYKYEIYGFLNLINKSVYYKDTDLKYVAFTINPDKSLLEIGQLLLDDDRIYKLKLESKINYNNILIASVDTNRNIQYLMKGDYEKY